MRAHHARPLAATAPSAVARPPRLPRAAHKSAVGREERPDTDESTSSYSALAGARDAAQQEYELAKRRHEVSTGIGANTSSAKKTEQYASLQGVTIAPTRHGSMLVQSTSPPAGGKKRGGPGGGNLAKSSIREAALGDLPKMPPPPVLVERARKGTDDIASEGASSPTEQHSFNRLLSNPVALPTPHVRTG